MSKRILVVDDEAHIVQVLMLKLRNAGFAVSSASDGEEGLEIALKERPDLIITDYQMPYMTGLELCRALAKHETTRNTPVLMLTARGYALDAEDLALVTAGSGHVGAKPMIREVLTKPFSPRAVVDQIQRILNDLGDGSMNGRPQHSETSGDGSGVGTGGQQPQHMNRNRREVGAFVRTEVV